MAKLVLDADNERTIVRATRRFRMSPLAPRRFGATPEYVVLGPKRTSTGRQDRLHRSLMTQSDTLRPSITALRNS